MLTMKIEKSFKLRISSLRRQWFIEIEQSIHFEDDKPKASFSSWMKSSPKLNISYEDCFLKQHSTVEYLGCYNDSNLNGDSMVRRVLKKINIKLNFLWRQTNYLNFSSRRLLSYTTSLWIWMHIMVSSSEKYLKN